jgi:hypothetical protein
MYLPVSYQIRCTSEIEWLGFMDKSYVQFVESICVQFSCTGLVSTRVFHFPEIFCTRTVSLDPQGNQNHHIEQGQHVVGPHVKLSRHQARSNLWQCKPEQGFADRANLS